MLKHHLKLVPRRRTFWTAAPPSSPFTKYSENYPSKIDHKILFSSLPPTQLTRLPNRLRVATQLLPTNNTTTVGIWVDPGPYLTSSKWKGVNHVLDRVIYKGTDLEKEIAMMGGDLLALTSREQISFQATNLIGGGGDVSLALQFLGAVLEYPRFGDEDVHREFAMVSRERQEAEDQLAKEFLLEHLHACAFEISAPGTPIVGSATKVITKEDVRNYMSEHFTPDRMVVVAAGGGIRHEEITEQAKSIFNKPGRGVSLDRLVKQGKDLYKKVLRAPKILFEEPEDIFTGSEVRFEDCGEALGKFAIAFKGASWSDADSVQLMVIKELLSSTLLARLGSEGIAENMTIFNTNYKDVGLFGVYAISKPEFSGDLASLVMLELTQLCSKVSRDDLVRARNKVKASLLLNMDKTKCVAEDIGCQILAHGQRIPYAELFEDIDAVDVKDIKAVVSRFIYNQDIVVVAAGAVQGIPDYNWFRRRTFGCS
ncbi:Mitochondrial processing peptidase, beta subunit, and related enzymes (Insulinase superfamily) [Heracleum sosnowskyi]|uniref:Mitochondrial processing peptidase, beta subunit, and related enzymes (Insulinase superfamily) n=1 Tax=Heracleum sosnowskyi TaxID=360622 RepID=A0AAD8IK94_9APIA|nr:Mitochondrial processing peptidase, beta subunit, and related enzymes (Insulinase superfamily) [Heracleum sosnowskyi]